MEIDKFIRSKRRTIAIIIERDGSVTVRAPRRASVASIQAFVDEKQGWILNTKEKLKTFTAPVKREYKDGERFLFLGDEYLLQIVNPQRPALTFSNGFALGSTAQPRGEHLFTRWYKEQAMTVLSERVRSFSAQYGFLPKQVKVSSAKTRWGSCSPDGTLNFTWRLVMAPLPVIDYVVVHELVHLKVKNHSKLFWREVEKYMPTYKEHRKWLRTYGETLNL